ncbi:MAG: 30S ribosomal protein S4 [Candidatus Pacebacteria bacterium]|nr:30S ribosomal protein S4 [Candidatus Paceibacterota bacterium]
MKIGPRYKIARRLGSPIYEKTQNPKFAIREARRGRKEYKHPKQRSEFGIQLIEKQKARLTYGMGERQFGRYVAESTAKKGAKPTDTLYTMLESRLDNVVYRMGLAPTRAAARQMVNHGHINLNGKRVSLPSAQTKVGDIVAIRERSVKKPLFAPLEERLKTYTCPSWIKFDNEKKTGTIQGAPKADPTTLAFSLPMIMEFYSR